MIVAPEERRSQGPLIVFIDLLFLLVAFFVLLLFFIQERHQLSDRQLEAVQESLARITGEEVNVPEALETLELVVERFLTAREEELERERIVAARKRRRAERERVRLEYRIDDDGRIVHEGRRYTPLAFLEAVVVPLRKSKWVAFRAYADRETSFGTVVDTRRVLLQDSNEFDTYWDNVTRKEQDANDAADTR